jgi:PadR family transcriptional regulator PadR
MSYNLVHMKETTNPGDFEQLILLAILRLQEQEAYGVSIRDEIARNTSRSPTPGAIYTTLERLEAKELVSSQQGEATAARGGRAKRCYRITDRGLKALRQAQADYKSLMKGLSLLEMKHAQA